MDHQASDLYNITVLKCEGLDGKVNYKTQSRKSLDETVVFDTYEEARAYWDHAACQVVYDLFLARALCQKALTLCPRDQKVFNDWADGKRPFMPKRLSKLSFSIKLPVTWKAEAEILAQRYGTIAKANLTVLLAQAQQEVREAIR